MAASRKLGIGLACIATATAALILWLHERHAAETKKLSIAANEIRVHAEQGDAAAQNRLGNLYLRGKGVPKDYPEAALWYRKGAEQGNPKAQFNVGKMYELGEGVPKDYAEALRWLTKSADQNDTLAESALGYMYFNGEGVARDECQGFAWYGKAAEAGYLPAQQFVGWMYFNGRGAQQDYTQAAAWYEKAASQGDAFSQASLGYMNWYGLGVERDRFGSVRYYRMAAAQGEPSAKQFLSSLKPPTLTRRIDLSIAVAGFLWGIFCMLAFLEFLVRRKPVHWRVAIVALLGIVWLAIAAMSFYQSAHDVHYILHRNAFHVTKWILFAMAVVITAVWWYSQKGQPPQSSLAGSKVD